MTAAPFSKRIESIFCGPQARVMIHGTQHGSEDSSIALQFVGYNLKWFLSLAAQ
jgi:hypothetical protein